VSGDEQIFVAGTVAAPLEYITPGAVVFKLKAATAEFDGSGAGSDFLPALELVSDGGHVIARAVAQEVKITAGGSAEVSWFPWRHVKVPCPSASYGVSLCGGDTAGPIASGVGTDTLVLTLTRAVTCDCTLHVVAAGVTVNSAFPDVASVVDNVTDSLGSAYDFGDSGAAQIGPIGQQSDANTSRLILGPTAIRACASGGMSVGDTVTVHFHTAYPALFASAGMVFAVANTKEDGIANDFSGTVRYGDGDSYDGIGADPTTLSWDIDQGFKPAPVGVAGMIAANAAYPAVGGFAPLEGNLLGAIDGTLSLAFSALPHVEANVGHDPGGSWGGAAQALVGNFQFITLTGA
jgi:hypothetical protein